MKVATLALLVLSTAAAAEPTSGAEAAPTAAPKRTTVLCTIRSPGEDGKIQTYFDGPCLFLPDGKGGSFSLSALDVESPLYGRILDVSVTVVAPGEAEVRGLTTEGINSRWGEARRSKKDPACWTGSDFEICARRKK